MMQRTKQNVIDRLKAIQQDRHWNQLSIEQLEEQIYFIELEEMDDQDRRQRKLFLNSIEMYKEDNAKIDEETNRLLDELNLLNHGE